MADTQTAKGWINNSTNKKSGKIGIQRKHINHSNKFLIFVRCIHSYTSEVCNKAWEYLSNPRPITHPVDAWSTSLSPEFALTHSDTGSRPLQIFALNFFTVNNNYLYMLLFTFTYNCFVQWVRFTDGVYTCNMYLQLTSSVHGMLDVHKSRVDVLIWLESNGWDFQLLVRFSGNIWVRISQCSTEFLISICKVATFW